MLGLFGFANQSSQHVVEVELWLLLRNHWPGRFGGSWWWKVRLWWVEESTSRVVVVYQGGHHNCRWWDVSILRGRYGCVDDRDGSSRQQNPPPRRRDRQPRGNRFFLSYQLLEQRPRVLGQGQVGVAAWVVGAFPFVVHLAWVLAVEHGALEALLAESGSVELAQFRPSLRVLGCVRVQADVSVAAESFPEELAHLGFGVESSATTTAAATTSAVPVPESASEATTAASASVKWAFHTEFVVWVVEVGWRMTTSSSMPSSIIIISIIIFHPIIFIFYTEIVTTFISRIPVS